MIEINTQSSIKIGKIYFDPYEIEEETHDAEIVFITHSHYDHFDLESIRKIINNQTVIVAPDAEEIKRSISSELTIVTPNSRYEVKGVTFETVPAYNINKPFHKKTNGWVGYVVYLDQIYYIMGDTDAIEEAKRIKCDYLFIPIGGTYTMDYKEAANLTNIIKPTYVTPTHYGSIVGRKEDGENFKKLVNKGINVKILLK